MDRIKASSISQFLGEPMVGDDINIDGVATAKDASDGTLSFLSKNYDIEKTSFKALYLIPKDKEIPQDSLSSYIKVFNPRLAFAKVVNKFFNGAPFLAGISSLAKIGKNVYLAEGVTIGDHCVIGDNVSIGKNTKLNYNIVIAPHTIIGDNCYIKSSSVIGEDGFGFDFEEDGTPVRIPHIGKVIIGNDVEIGANCSIARGTIGNTIIHDSVKIDDMAFIAHNCEIGEKTIITAHAEFSGSVKMGKRCWVGPNASIIQKVTIGDGVKIGIGAVVTGDIPENTIVMGLDALPIKMLVNFKNKNNYPSLRKS